MSKPGYESKFFDALKKLEEGTPKDRWFTASEVLNVVKETYSIGENEMEDYLDVLPEINRRLQEAGKIIVKMEPTVVGGIPAHKIYYRTNANLPNGEIVLTPPPSNEVRRNGRIRTVEKSEPWMPNDPEYESS